MNGELTAILREIADIEARPGFEGPTITEELELFERSVSLLTSNDVPGGYWFPEIPSEWIEAQVVDRIVRAAKSHRNPKNDLEDWMIDIEDGGDGHFVVLIKDRLGHKIGVGQGHIALAAAHAYRDAIKETTK